MLQDSFSLFFLIEMRPENFVIEHIRKMQGYVPGLQPQSQNKERIIKLNTNENPFPPSQQVLTALKKAIDSQRLQLYPNPTASELRKCVAESFDLSPEYVLLGNGSDEVLSILLRSLLLSKDALLMCQPSYSLYPVIVQLLNAKIFFTDLKEDWHVNFEKLTETVHKNSEIKIVVLVNPNAPTSLAEKEEDLLHFIKNNPCLTLVDEAYMPFHSYKKNTSIASFIKENHYERLVVSGTFSKAYSLAGQRIGWLIARPELIQELDKMRDSYNLNFLGQVAGLVAWKDQSQVRKNIETIIHTREKLVKDLGLLGFTTLTPSANFIFTKPNFTSAEKYSTLLTENKIYVRHWKDQGRVSEYVRISIGTQEDMDVLVDVTQKLMRSNK